MSPLKRQSQNRDLALPTGKGARKAQQIAKAILTEMARGNPDEPTYTGGCRAFYTPEEWRQRGEDYGRNSALIICHDGGEVGDFFSYDHGNYERIDQMTNALRAIGYYAEQCTSWYSAVYPL